MKSKKLVSSSRKEQRGKGVGVFTAKSSSSSQQQQTQIYTSLGGASKRETNTKLPQSNAQHTQTITTTTTSTNPIKLPASKPISGAINDNPINSQNNNNKLITTFGYICSGCNKPIKREKFLLKACEKYWHENCLRCDRCHSRLGELGSSLYFKSNMNLCRQDYLELFGETGICSLCEKIICASEMVMRAKENVYHLECFACQLCSQRFCVGDRFYLWENKVVCQYDYEEHILPIQNSLQLELLVSNTSQTTVQVSSTCASRQEIDSSFKLQRQEGEEEAPKLDYSSSCSNQMIDNNNNSTLFSLKSTCTKSSDNNKQEMMNANNKFISPDTNNDNNSNQQNFDQQQAAALSIESAPLPMFEQGDEEMRKRLIDLSNSSSKKRKDDNETGHMAGKCKENRLDQSMGLLSATLTSSGPERKEDKVIN